jgi:hypothetical protein
MNEYIPEVPAEIAQRIRACINDTYILATEIWASYSKFGFYPATTGDFCLPAFGRVSSSVQAIKKEIITAERPFDAPILYLGIDRNRRQTLAEVLISVFEPKTNSTHESHIRWFSEKTEILLLSVNSTKNISDEHTLNLLELQKVPAMYQIDPFTSVYHGYGTVLSHIRMLEEVLVQANQVPNCIHN